MNKRNIRVSLAIDSETDNILQEISTTKGISKATLIYSYIYSNDEVVKIRNDQKK